MATPTLPPGAPPIPVSTLPPHADCVALADRIKGQFPGQIKEVKALNPMNPGIQLEKNVLCTFDTNHAPLLDFWKWLRDKEEFEHCSLVVAIDHMDRIEVKHVLFNYKTHVSVETSVTCDRMEPLMPSASLLWRGANWLEREQYDLMGVKFHEHPDLRRVLLPSDWIGHPLRKDYEFRQAGEWW